MIRASWGIFYDMPHTLFYYNYSSEPPWGSRFTNGASGRIRESLAGLSGRNPFPTNLASSDFPTAGYYETVPLNVRSPMWNNGT